MARVRIRVGEMDALPPVCSSCGEPATCEKRETYGWNPSWLPVLLFASPVVWLLFFILTRKTVDLSMPVCDRHRSRGRRAMKVLLAGATLAGLAGAATYALRGQPLGRDLMGVTVAVAVITVFAAFFASEDWIRARAIDKRGVTLDGVSKAFAEAVDGDRGPRAAVPSGGIELATAKYLRR